jgi:hypothetical protein
MSTGFVAKLQFLFIAAGAVLALAPAAAQPRLHVPSPDWRDQILYFVMTDRFADGDPANNDQGAGEYRPGEAPRRFVWNPTVKIPVVVEPGGHVGRLRLSLSTCPRGGCQENGFERWN